MLLAQYQEQVKDVFLNSFFINIINDLICKPVFDHFSYNSYTMVVTKWMMVGLLVVVSVISASHLNLLANCELELMKMVSLHQKGDSSTAFSIAMKVYFAVKMLHQDLEMDQVPMTPLHLLADTSCKDQLAEIVRLSASRNLPENFQTITSKIGEMQQKCTNSDFIQLESKGEPNGFDDKCALCVVILRVMENYIAYHKVDISNFVNNQFCTFFDGDLKPTCTAFVHYAGPVLIQTLINKEPSDKVCLKIGYCNNPQCRIVKSLAEQFNIDLENLKLDRPHPWKWLVHIFVDKFGDKHLPPFDMDNDTFSDVSTFRGYHWRGADCNELNEKVYPGRKNGSKIIDQDCNGIFGLDNRGRLYEDKFCKEYKRMGLAVIGDSAGAHFSIPEKFFNASMIGKGTYNDLLPRVADELDIPHESGYTGHVNTTYKSHSVYKYLRDWNICNNNDYQNTGVNGGDAGNSWGNIKALRRDPQNDYPLLMFMQLIGNDVCKKSFDSMTKPADFKRDILKLLNWLDTTTPKGSHLMIFGLGDGDVLYQNLHADIHPLNVTYATVYDFLNCLKISPCWGWLNSNDTVRQFTTQRAKNLSKMYQEIIDDGTTFKNFDMVYYDFPAMEILERKVREGGDPKEMIERCDGFHPNVQFNSYLADWIWVKLQTQHPSWIGQRNPHNDEIRRIFGLEVIK